MSVNCPICNKPVASPAESRPKWFPFCSERCRQIDLLRWSTGKYAIVENMSREQIAQKRAEDSDDESV